MVGSSFHTLTFVGRGREWPEVIGNFGKSFPLAENFDLAPNRGEISKFRHKIIVLGSRVKRENEIYDFKESRFGGKSFSQKVQLKT